MRGVYQDLSVLDPPVNNQYWLMEPASLDQRGDYRLKSTDGCKWSVEEAIRGTHLPNAKIELDHSGRYSES